jgi:sulfur-oxidizing protein SoxA
MTRGGILASAAAAAIAAGVFGLTADAQAQATGKQAPLELKGEASVQPWKRYPGWPARDESKWSTLAKVSSPPAPKEARKLAGPIAGDAEKGAKLVADRNRGGSCLACHVMGQAGNADQPGNVGPDLSEIGNAGLSDEQLFNFIYDARVYNADTVMPPWGSHGVFTDAEINDMVAFLKTLKKPAVFKVEVDNPERRGTPVEKRDNLDALENPGMWALDRAAVLWRTRGPTGFACGTCHNDPKTAFKAWAASMPKWEPRLNKVLGIEEFVTRHAKATTGASYLMETEQNRDLSIYLHNLANGAPINVDTSSPEAKAAIERGVELANRKIGELNFACTDCHGKVANHWIRGQWLGAPKGQYDHFPTWRTSLQTVWDIRQRFQWCQVNIRADELPPDAKEYGDLELYLASLNNGLKLSVPGIRH